MDTNILIVLGSPNSPEGVLSKISKSRLNYCKSIFKKGDRVICTGGWGPQFNTAKYAHAYYAKAYLKEQGLLEDDFLDFALSKHTVDDAVKLLPILAEFKEAHLTIITSDYHLERVVLIFKEILSNFSIKCIGVVSHLDKAEYDVLVAHEKKSVQGIIEKGLYY